MSLFYVRSFLQGSDLVAEVNEKEHNDPRLIVDEPGSVYSDEHDVSWRKFSTRERAELWATIVTENKHLRRRRNYREQMQRWRQLVAKHN